MKHVSGFDQFNSHEWATEDIDEIKYALQEFCEDNNFEYITKELWKETCESFSYHYLLEGHSNGVISFVYSDEITPRNKIIMMWKKTTGKCSHEKLQKLNLFIEKISHMGYDSSFSTGVYGDIIPVLISSVYFM